MRVFLTITKHRHCKSTNITKSIEAVNAWFAEEAAFKAQSKIPGSHVVVETIVKPLKNKDGTNNLVCLNCFDNIIRDGEKCNCEEAK